MHFFEATLFLFELGRQRLIGNEAAVSPSCPWLRLAYRVAAYLLSFIHDMRVMMVHSSEATGRRYYARDHHLSLIHHLILGAVWQNDLGPAWASVR